MKPTKNRVMCPDCFRQKMLFETQKEADNFIKWNGDDIDTHGGELRSYYCKACGGWHITSKPFKYAYTNNTDKLIKAYERDKKTEEELKKGNTEDCANPKAKEIFGKFIADFPEGIAPTRRFLKDYLDVYVKVNKVDLEHCGIDALRHLIYNHYLK